jgi:hypothetical protein
MSHADDAKRRTGLRDWLIASFVLVAPLLWVGTQSRDLPLYMIGSSKPAYAAATPGAARLHAVHEGVHAPLLSDTRVLFALKAIDARAGDNVPWLRGAHADASAFQGKRSYAMALGSPGAQPYPLAAAERR